MRIITRSIGDVIGKSKILLNLIPISSCKFNIIDNIINIYYEGKLISEFELKTNLSSNKLVEVAIVEFYNKLVLLSNNTYTVCNMTDKDFEDLVINQLHNQIEHLKKCGL